MTTFKNVSETISVIILLWLVAVMSVSMFLVVFLDLDRKLSSDDFCASYGIIEYVFPAKTISCWAIDKTDKY